MTHITLVPQGGLCNRLRAALSALWLTEQFSDCRVEVAWAVSAECAAPFHRLFEPESYTGDRFSVRPYNWFYTPVCRANLHLPGLLRRFCYDAQWVNFRSNLTATQLSRRIAVHRRLYVSTGYDLCATPGDMWRRLQPLPHLQRKIEALSRSFSRHTVGLHIRRTDNAVSMAHSTEPMFFEAIRRTISEDPMADFFLATDDHLLKDRLREAFPDRIFTQHCRGSRAELRGIEEAVVDLFCLARTSRLLGSYWSSFTDAAAQLGNLPLLIIDNSTSCSTTEIPS